MILPKRNKIDKNKKINFLHLKYNNIIHLKPSGFWYSCHNDWYNWIIKIKILHFLHKYIHKINLCKNIMTNIHNKDKNKLLVIKTMKDFDIFNKRYRIEENTYSLINWKIVAKDYGGIEICPFISKRKNYIWYSSWDVASGCIWNIKSIIKNTELIYEKKKNKYVKVK